MLALALLVALGPAPPEDGRPDWLDDLEGWTPESDPERAPTPEPESEPEPEPEDPLDESVVGAFRLVAAYLHFIDSPQSDDALVATVGRLIASKDLAQRVDMELNVFVELARAPSHALAGAFATAGSFVSPYRAPQLTLDARNQGPLRVQFGIDRARLGFHFERVALDFGRFPVNYTVTQILTPNDLFAPFSATAINRSYKPGVDAVRLGFTLGQLASLEFVGVAASRWGDAALLARPSIVLWNFEWAAIGGKVAQRWLVGASLQGDAGPIGLRAEGHVGFPDRDGDGLDDADDIHVRIAAGPNVNFNWQSATIGAEYGYFSAGEIDPAGYIARFGRRFPDDLPYLGRHYVGLVTGLEAAPTLRLSATGLVNAGDRSGLVGLAALYSVANEVDLAFGGFVPWGRATTFNPTPALGSEFGAQPLTVFVESRVFF